MVRYLSSQVDVVVQFGYRTNPTDTLVSCEWRCKTDFDLAS